MGNFLAGTPVDDDTGRHRTYQAANQFQTDMLGAPCADCPKTGWWFCCQCLGVTSCCTQYCLRGRVLDGDYSKYECCQGYFNCICFRAGQCGESSCPQLCLCCESLFCNACAISASRMYVMEKFDLSSDPCDYRLIRISNCIFLLSCVCDIMAIFDENFRSCADFLRFISDLIYHTVSGCMTAQVIHELDYQQKIGGNNARAPTGVVIGTAPEQKFGVLSPAIASSEGYSKF